MRFLTKLEREAGLKKAKARKPKKKKKAAKRRTPPRKKNGEFRKRKS